MRLKIQYKMIDTIMRDSSAAAQILVKITKMPGDYLNEKQY